MPALLPARSTPPSYSQGKSDFAGELAYPSARDGLVGMWGMFLGTTGQRVHDHSGHHDDATLTNMDLSNWRRNANPRAPGYALDFDGTTEYVQTTSNILKTANDFTIVTRFLSRYVFDDALLPVMLWQGDVLGNGGGAQQEFDMGFGRATFSPNTRNVFFFFMEGGVTANDIRMESLFVASDLGAWNHGVVTVQNLEGSYIARLYLNGVEVTSDLSGSIASRANWDTDLRFGTTGTVTRNFDGLLDEVRIYDRVFPAAEVVEDFRIPRRASVLRGRTIRKAPAGVTVAISGTTTTGIDEDDVTGVAQTTILTLTGDTWVAAGATFDAQRQAIINGVTSAQSETLGWNNEVRDTALVAAVVRDSDTQVTITWATAQTASYDITAQETIEVTVPAAALVTSLISVVGTPTFTVDAVAVGGRIMSSLVGAGGLAGMGGIAGQGGGLAA